MKKMIDRVDLHKIQKKLDTQRDEIIRRIEGIRHQDQGSGVMNPDRDDLAYHYAYTEMQSVELAGLEERLDQIDTALTRIKDGQYGVCAHCGESINPARLHALPSASLCIRCQERIS